MDRAHLTGSHGEHDPSWTFQGGEGAPPSCLACLVEIIENKKVPKLRKSKVLGELLAYLHASREKADLLNSDLRVTTHLVLLLIDLLKSGDQNIQEIATMCAVKILCLVKSEEVLCCTLDTISLQTLKVCNLVQSIPVFCLLGQMLDAIPQLASQLLRCYGSLVDYMASGLSYPDDDLQASLCYLWLHLYSADNTSKVSAPLSKKVIKALVDILATTNRNVLIMNALGTIKVMLTSEDLMDLLVCPQQEARGITGGLKRSLVAKHEMVPVAAAQCISVIIESQKRGQHYAELFLQEDTAEFLFDSLTTANELLLSSVWCCLMKLSDYDMFYEKYHAVYGMESIIRGVEQAFRMRNPHVIILAMSVLAKILQRHDGQVRLLGQENLVMRCLQVTEEGCGSPHHNVFLQSAKTFLQLVRKHHLHSPVPFGKIWETIVLLLQRLRDGGKMHSIPAKSNRPNREETEGRALKSLMIQKSIVLTTAVLHQAARLVAECKLDPTSDASCYSKPDEKTASQTEVFSQKIIGALDETCVPLLMANCNYLQDDFGYMHVCGAMNTLLQCYEPLTVELLHKMTGTGVMTALMEMKNRFSQETLKEVNVLLTNLCLSQFDPDETPVGFTVALHNSISQLKGGGNEMCQVLKQKWLDCDDGNFKNLQHAVLLLIFAVTLHGDSLAPPRQIMDAVLGLVLNHHDALSQQPNIVIRAMVYIVATNTIILAEKCEGEWQHSPGEWTLLKYLHNQAKVEDWVCFQPQLLQWVFISPQLTNVLAKSLLQYWLKNKQKLDAIKTLIKDNSSCLRITLGLLSKGGDEECLLVSEIIAEILNGLKDDATSKKQLEIIQEVMPDVIIQQLLSLDPNFTEENLAMMFRLVSKIKIQTTQDHLVERNFKLAFHVCRYLSDANCPSSDVMWSACNLLSCLLIQSFNENDTRVAAMILSNSSMLQRLQSLLEKLTSPHPAATLISFLAIQQNMHNLEVAHSLSVPIKTAIQGLISSDSHLTVCCLHLLTATLSTRGQSKLLQCHLGSSREELFSQEDRDLPFTTQQLTLLLFHLQQCFLKDTPCVQELAANCLLSLLLLVKPLPNLNRHMLEQPWTKVILRAALTIHGNDCLPSWLIKLTSLLLQGKSRYVNQSLANRIGEEFINKFPESSWSYFRLTEATDQIYEQNMLHLKPERMEELSDKLKEARCLFEKLPEFRSPYVIINCVDDLVCGIVM